MIKQRLWLVLVLLMAIVALIACGNSDEDDEAPEDVNAILNAAADELDNAESFQLVLQTSGAPTTFVFAGFDAVIFNNATATFISPNTVKADLSVAIGASTQKGEIVAVEDRQYFNQPLITGGEWDAMELVPNFEPADLQSPETGIGSALRNMRDVEFIGNEEVNSLAVHHIRGTVDAERVRSVTVGLMSTATGDIVIDIYVRRDGTNRVALIELEEPSPPDSEEDLSKTWEIEFRGYNQDYTINEPEVASAS